MENIPPKMREIEMAVAFGSGVWRAEFIVEIPDDTPEDKVDFTAMAAIMDRGGLEDVAHIWVYNTMEDARPE